MVWNPCSVTTASDVQALWKSGSDNIRARSIIFARNLLQTALYRATPQGDNEALFRYEEAVPAVVCHLWTNYSICSYGFNHYV